MAIHGCHSVKLQQICLQSRHHSIRHASLSIENQREKLLDLCPPIIHANIHCEALAGKTVATLSMQHLGLVPLRLEWLCRCSCNKYACKPSVTYTNTPAVQTCLLVECCCKIDDCWTTKSACLPIFYHSILHAWCCTSLSAIPTGVITVSLSAVPAGVVPHYRPCLLMCCLTVGYAFWCGASLSTTQVGMVPH